MRLDHLLSKELISTRPHIVGVAGPLYGARSSGRWLVLVAEARPRPYASGVVAHGWNIDEESLVGCSKLVRLRPLLRAGGVCGAGTWRVSG